MPNRLEYLTGQSRPKEFDLDWNVHKAIHNSLLITTMCLDTFYYEETSEAMPNHLWRRGNYATTGSCSAIRKLWKKK